MRMAPLPCKERQAVNRYVIAVGELNRACGASGEAFRLLFPVGVHCTQALDQLMADWSDDELSNSRPASVAAVGAPAAAATAASAADANVFSAPVPADAVITDENRQAVLVRECIVCASCVCV